MGNIISYTQFIAARSKLMRRRLLAQFETAADAPIETLAELMCEDEEGPSFCRF